jgi:polysaccharide biosynthesis/export protein
MDNHRLQAMCAQVLFVSFALTACSSRAALLESRLKAAAPADVSTKAGLSATAAAIPAPEYVIGIEDHLSILFFDHRDMSTDVVVRPDGKISLPLLNDLQADGLTPEQLREKIIVGAKRFIQEPNPTVVVRQINSRRVFITGAIQKPGLYPLMARTTVLQLIATAGGLKEEAEARKVTIMRVEAGRSVSLPFNYIQVVDERKHPEQDIELKPGDIVVVPGS